MPYGNPETCTKEFVLKFIELYKSKESLWCVKSKSYQDRAKKRREYQDMVTLMRTVDPNSNVSDVKKKVNNLRSSFRKELRKVQDTLGDDNPHVPRLWYFNQLLFLEEEELRGALLEGSRTEGIEPKTELTETDDFDAVERKYFDQDDPLEWGVDVTLSDPEPSSSDTRIILETPSQGIKRKRDTDSDECDIVSRHIAAKLRTLSNEQKIHAEKLINDVLYEGQLNNLSRKARVVVEDDALKHDQ